MVGERRDYLGATSNKGWWNYVHNMNNVAQELFSNNMFEDTWLGPEAPTR